MLHTSNKRLLQHVEDICAVSPFLDPEEYYPYALARKLETYLAASRARMEVLLGKFEEMDYTKKIQQWNYYDHECCNVIFRKGHARDDETWIVAHHDYCAAKGAEDNATALSVMIETARLTSHLDLPVAFASFDLEERDIRGAWEYVNRIPQKSLHRRIKQIIDLECLGSGKDLLLIEKGHVLSDKKLNDRIDDIAESLDINLIRADCHSSYADHVPFAKKGIPVTQMASTDYDGLRACHGRPKNLQSIGLISHSEKDIPANIRPKHLMHTTQILTAFLQQS